MSSTIDWEEQWSVHAKNFYNGRAHIPLPTGDTVDLLPGPGFGDDSHATSRLMIELMAPHVVGKPVFDIGSGSGILTVAAAKMGAKQLFFCDIDPEAESHTLKNGAANGFLFSKAQTFPEKPVVLMNMIAQEQAAAWEKQKCPFDRLITSGILKEQKDSYLKFAAQMGWTQVEERERGGWLGFIFKETQ